MAKKLLFVVNVLQNKKNIKEFGYTIPLGPENPNANKHIDLYFKILIPEYFANADKIKVSYTYEKDILNKKEWEIKAKSELLATALGYGHNYKKILQLLIDEDKKILELWDKIILIEEEYLKD